MSHARLRGLTEKAVPIRRPTGHLFVSQRFNGIEASGANGGQHPTDQRNCGEDKRSNEQRHGINE